MITRKQTLALCLGLFLLGCTAIGGHGVFVTESFAQQNIEFQLTSEKAKALLRCPTDESKAFVDDCFELVSLGKIPQSAVLSSFDYAMGQTKINHRWFYFQKSMEQWASKLNVNLDTLRATLKKK